MDVEDSVVLRPDPESASAVAQERGRRHLRETGIDGKRFECSIDETLELPGRGHRDRPALVVDERVDRAEGARHRVQRWRRLRPAPKAGGRPDPEFAGLVFV